ncbi:MAG: hypothetical protein CML33_05865 [Rhodobacteraceae bacterium]|nr:hypothetical protein [Paracoccaceae bacterium]
MYLCMFNYMNAYVALLLFLFQIQTIPVSNALILSNRVKMTALERMKHLDLIWKIREEMDECDITKEELCGKICPTCEGEGNMPCRFCGGTGFLMLGHELIGTNNDCPVCKGSGYEECKDCMGAGSIAIWREDHK